MANSEKKGALPPEGAAWICESNTEFELTNGRVLDKIFPGFFAGNHRNFLPQARMSDATAIARRCFPERKQGVDSFYG
jgi:hypothetical protein